MADVIKDWTDEEGQPKQPTLTQAAIGDLADRLDNAIMLAQQRLTDLKKESRDLEGQLNRMHDTKQKLSVLTWASSDTEQIEAGQRK